MHSFTMNLKLTEAERGVFNEGRRQGWVFARSGTPKVNPYGTPFEHELFEDGFRKGEAAFWKSKQLT